MSFCFEPPRPMGQSEEGLDVLQKISYKWGTQLYYRKGAHAQVYAILKNTTRKGRLTNINKNLNWADLSKINVTDEEVQNDWETAREILCKIPRSPIFYKNEKTRLENEIAGTFLKFIYKFSRFYSLIIKIKIPYKRHPYPRNPGQKDSGCRESKTRIR